ncbi:hypothetical protein JTB14_009711 [Gonioctena quinquepunctata]|nr:hypothetical protein JTB14_009711 [Gonioctena quinquepunctata]
MKKESEWNIVEKRGESKHYASSTKFLHRPFIRLGLLFIIIAEIWGRSGSDGKEVGEDIAAVRRINIVCGDSGMCDNVEKILIEAGHAPAPSHSWVTSIKFLNKS